MTPPSWASPAARAGRARRPIVFVDLPAVGRAAFAEKGEDGRRGPESVKAAADIYMPVSRRSRPKSTRSPARRPRPWPTTPTRSRQAGSSRSRISGHPAEFDDLMDSAGLRRVGQELLNYLSFRNAEGAKTDRRDFTEKTLLFPLRASRSLCALCVPETRIRKLNPEI